MWDLELLLLELGDRALLFLLEERVWLLHSVPAHTLIR